jgi:hypothetical protein
MSFRVIDELHTMTEQVERVDARCAQHEIVEPEVDVVANRSTTSSAVVRADTARVRPVGVGVGDPPHLDRILDGRASARAKERARPAGGGRMPPSRSQS